jgi:hypothetical protein
MKTPFDIITPTKGALGPLGMAVWTDPPPWAYRREIGSEGLEAYFTERVDSRTTISAGILRRTTGMSLF